MSREEFERLAQKMIVLEMEMAQKHIVPLYGTKFCVYLLNDREVDPDYNDAGKQYGVHGLISAHKKIWKQLYQGR